MPVWRCPHCGIPQPETARCWVCHRSTTTCGTCRHFRRGVAGGLGLCGLDARRLAVGPAEVRPCWTASAPGPSQDMATSSDPAPQPGAGVAATSSAVAVTSAGRPGRTFVPVDELAGASVQATTEQAIGAPKGPGRPSDTAESRRPDGVAGPPVAAAPAADPRVGAAPRWSLWGDLEG